MPSFRREAGVFMSGSTGGEHMVADTTFRPSMVPKPNGRAIKSGLEVIESTSLSAERAAAIEYGLTQFQNTLAERDRLAEDLRRAEDRNHLVRAEVEMRDRTIMDLQRRIGELEADRDRKVADFAILETLFLSLRAQLDAFVKLPPAKEVTDSSQC
jgi:hypothetical protein